jgi:hypothetical protein
VVSKDEKIKALTEENAKNYDLLIQLKAQIEDIQD